MRAPTDYTSQDAFRSVVARTELVELFFKNLCKGGDHRLFEERYVNIKYSLSHNSFMAITHYYRTCISFFVEPFSKAPRDDCSSTSLLFSRWQGQFSCGYSDRDKQLITHFHLVPNLWMSGPIPPLQYIPSGFTQEQFYLKCLLLNYLYNSSCL
jgi:hypothetical protein